MSGPLAQTRLTTTAADSPLLSSTRQIFNRLFKPGWRVVRDSKDNGLCVRGYLQGVDYPRTVLIALPNNFKPGEKSPEMAVHLHGHLLVKNFAKEVQNQFIFESYLTNARRTRTVLVVPESSGNCVDYRKIENGQAFDKFTRELETAFTRSGLFSTLHSPPPILLSAHSGAGRVVEKLLRADEKIAWHGRLQRLSLLDATYPSGGFLQPSTIKSFNEILRKTHARCPLAVDVAYIEAPWSKTKVGAEKLLPYVSNVVRAKPGPVDHWSITNSLKNFWRAD